MLHKRVLSAKGARRATLISYSIFGISHYDRAVEEGIQRLSSVNLLSVSISSSLPLLYLVVVISTSYPRFNLMFRSIITDLLFISTYQCWRWNGARQKRPMSSIVLQPGVKDMLLADCKDFLQSEEWYAERGMAPAVGLDHHATCFERGPLSRSR